MCLCVYARVARKSTTRNKLRSNKCWLLSTSTKCILYLCVCECLWRSIVREVKRNDSISSYFVFFFMFTTVIAVSHCTKCSVCTLYTLRQHYRVHGHSHTGARARVRAQSYIYKYYIAHRNISKQNETKRNGSSVHSFVVFDFGFGFGFSFYLFIFKYKIRQFK